MTLFFGTNLSTGGSMYIFSCDAASARAAVNYAKQFYKGQSLYASSVIIDFSKTGTMSQKALSTDRGELLMDLNGGGRKR